MKGSMIQDIIRLTGILVLVFVVIFWGVSYGVGVVANLLVSSPYVLQDSLVSYLSISCMQENMTTTLRMEPYPMEIRANSTHVWVIPGKKFYGDITRGGFVKIRKQPAAPYVKCDKTDVAPHAKKFDEDTDTGVSVTKYMPSGLAHSMRIGVV